MKKIKAKVYSFNGEKNEYIMTDLLADVIIYPDGFVKVIDLEELVIALNDGILTIEQLKTSILTLNHLLELIYNGEFKSFQLLLEKYEQ